MKNDLNPPWNVAYEANGDTSVASRTDGSVVARVISVDIPNKWTQQRIAWLLSAAPDLIEIGTSIIKDHDKRSAKFGGFCGCGQCQRIQTALDKAEGKIT